MKDDLTAEETAFTEQMAKQISMDTIDAPGFFKKDASEEEEGYFFNQKIMIWPTIQSMAQK